MAMEAFGLAFAKSYGLGVTSLRFTNVYGEGSVDKTSVIANFCKQALQNGKIVVEGDGEQTRDFVYVGDVVEAIRVVENTPLPMMPPIIQVCGNNQVSINTIAEMIADMIGMTRVVHTKPRIGDVRENYPQEGISAIYGNTDIMVGIERTVNYFKGLT